MRYCVIFLTGCDLAKGVDKVAPTLVLRKKEDDRVWTYGLGGRIEECEGSVVRVLFPEGCSMGYPKNASGTVVALRFGERLNWLWGDVDSEEIAKQVYGKRES